MGGGGGNQSTTSTPWTGQQPYLSDLFQQGSNAYHGTGPQYFPDATYVPFAPQQEQAFGATENRAMGSPVESAFGNYLQGSLGQNQYNLDPAAYGANQAIGSIGAGQRALQDAATPNLTDMAGSAGVNRLVGNAFNNPFSESGRGGIDALTRTAGGDFLNANPYLDKTFGAASRQLTDQYQNVVNPSINATFGGAGRTGAGLQTQALGEAAGQYGNSLGDLATNIYGGNYATERQNQLGAAGTLSNLFQGGESNALQSALGLGNLYQGGRSNALQAGSALGQLGLGGISSLGGLYGNVSADQARAGAYAPAASAMDWNNIDRLAGVGTAVQGQAGNILQDAMNRFNFGQQQPVTNLQNYASLIYGLPGGYGTQNTSGAGQGSPLLGGLGGAGTGAGIASALGASTPVGWGLAGLGGLLGAFS